MRVSLYFSLRAPHHHGLTFPKQQLRLHPELDYIEEAEPFVNRYISVPADYGHFNCASFTAGIINGVLDSAGFAAEVTAKVLAKTGETDGQGDQPLTIYYIKFDTAVLEREKRLST